VSEDKDLILMGYSGHSYVVIDIAKSMGLIPIAYFEFKEALKNPYNIKYLGKENEYTEGNALQNKFVFPAVGDNLIRSKLTKLIKRNNWKETVIADSTSNISSTTSIGYSTLIGTNAIINSCTKIGEGVIINTGATIEHACIISDYVHVAPGAILAGGVKVGAMTFIGAGAIIINGVTIGSNSVIGAGAVVINDIPNNQTWVGNPAKRIK
tara:strand:+ start:124218 stop:124847 length:630 start_codon:yes stop_codon:yes gene_type:complete